MFLSVSLQLHNLSLKLFTLAFALASDVSPPAAHGSTDGTLKIGQFIPDVNPQMLFVLLANKPAQFSWQFPQVFAGPFQRSVKLGKIMEINSSLVFPDRVLTHELANAYPR